MISVKVKTRSRQSKVEPLGVAEYKVWVTEVPEKGRANEAVIELLSEHLGRAKSTIRLVSGASSTRKTFELLGEKS